MHVSDAWPSMFLGSPYTYIIERGFFFIWVPSSHEWTPWCQHCTKNCLTKLKQHSLVLNSKPCIRTHVSLQLNTLYKPSTQWGFDFLALHPTMAHLRPHRVCWCVCVSEYPSENVMPNALPISRSNLLNTHTSCPSRFPPQITLDLSTKSHSGHTPSCNHTCSAQQPSSTYTHTSVRCG